MVEIYSLPCAAAIPSNTGWEFRKDAHLYLVYNGLREEDDPETGHSLFIKLAYTFR